MDILCYPGGRDVFTDSFVSTGGVSIRSHYSVFIPRLRTLGTALVRPKPKG